MVVDLTHVVPGRFDIDLSLYPNATIMKTISFPVQRSVIDSSEPIMRDFLTGLDVIFTCETPYHYRLFELAREMGVKTVLQYNWEFMSYINRPHLPHPDLFVAPSVWHYDDLPFDNKTFLPVPVDRDKLTFRQRRQALTFLHSAGNRTAEDRNGTKLLLNTLPYIKSDVRFIVKSLYPIFCDDPRVEIHKSTDNY